jgi:hypothetical protein
MDDAEVDRVRKTIRNSLRNSPHKKKYWLALLDMYAKPEGRQGRSAESASSKSSRADLGERMPGTPNQRIK